MTGSRPDSKYALDAVRGLYLGKTVQRVIINSAIAVGLGEQRAQEIIDGHPRIVGDLDDVDWNALRDNPSRAAASNVIRKVAALLNVERDHLASRIGRMFGHFVGRSNDGRVFLVLNEQEFTEEMRRVLTSHWNGYDDWFEKALMATTISADGWKLAGDIDDLMVTAEVNDCDGTIQFRLSGHKLGVDPETNELFDQSLSYAPANRKDVDRVVGLYCDVADRLLSDTNRLLAACASKMDMGLMA